MKLLGFWRYIIFLDFVFMVMTNTCSQNTTTRDDVRPIFIRCSCRRLDIYLTPTRVLVFTMVAHLPGLKLSPGCLRISSIRWPHGYPWHCSACACLCVISISFILYRCIRLAEVAGFKYFSIDRLEAILSGMPYWI